MTHLLAIQHRLPSIAWFFSETKRLQLSSRTTLVAKVYSAIRFPIGLEFVDERESIRIALDGHNGGSLLALDEGGVLHAEISPELATRTAGIEQTTFGYRKDWNYPTVLVCRSAAKLLFESQIIARGILRKLDSLHIISDHKVGVIGLGALGAAMARALRDRGVETLGTEIGGVPIDLQTITVPKNELLHKCDVLLGCTGTDSLAGFEWTTIRGDRLFISCASSDAEFRCLLQEAPARDRFGTIEGSIGNMRFRVLNGGYPINFDRVREWELFEEIILTRRLVLEGLFQAKPLIGQRARGLMLEPRKQLDIVNEWLEQVPDRNKLRIPGELDEGFFRKHSEGELLMSEKPYTLHHTTPGALAKMRRHTGPYAIEVRNLPIIVLPTVWSPAYDWSSTFCLENFPDVTGLDFLEIGCGTGIISLVAARNGAHNVVAADVNPEAVRNTQLNFERYGIRNAIALISDVFSDIKGLFDIVTWNAPYHGSAPGDMLERGCADEDYRDIRAFFQSVDRYLKPGGLILFGFSESGDLKLIEELIAENGFRAKRKLSDWRQDYNCMLFELVRDLESGTGSKIH